MVNDLKLKEIMVNDLKTEGNEGYSDLKLEETIFEEKETISSVRYYEVR